MGLLKRHRRERIRRRPFPPAWQAILERTFPRHLRLSPEDRKELEGHIQVFLAEKRFEGAAGLAITDEIRVTIAAQACFLLLHRDTDFYPGLYSIIVYPEEYVASYHLRDERGFVEEGPQVRLGEASGRGAVVLSWDGALRGASDVEDCHNVVFHEFAHQLDAESGSFDGAPLLPERSMYLAWARTLSEEWHALRARASRHEPTDLDPYGATNPAEFFAVVTECFFQRPHQLRETHPKLYEELERFYRQDPTSSMPST
ncbi:MAG: zinc-dependent peptidase [Candidatus Bipolaricaulota bacterium]|nr:zinc-dependent peptidase [Candidatus Bipolaricaulota bacterium]